jgi:drug/metabolite transporter (DMT)-like permease
MLGTLLALSCSALWGTSDFLGGYLARQVQLSRVVLVSQLTGLVAIVILACVVSGAPTLEPRTLLAFPAGISFVIGIGSFYRALAVGSMGVVAPIAALGALIPIAGGLISGDRPGAPQFLGMAVALVGVAVTTREVRSEQTPEGARNRQSIVLAVLAGAGFGLTQLALAVGAESDPYWSIAFVRVAAVVTLLLYIVTFGPGLASVRARHGRSVWPLLLIGIVDVAAMTAFTVSTNHGDLSVVTVLSSLYPVVTVLLATVLLRERLNRPQVIGASVTLAGAILLAAG